MIICWKRLKITWNEISLSYDLYFETFWIGKIKTPDNLEELISLLAREVIRSNPSDIHKLISSAVKNYSGHVWAEFLLALCLSAFISNLLSKMVSLRDGELRPARFKKWMKLIFCRFRMSYPSGWIVDTVSEPWIKFFNIEHFTYE